MKRTLLIFLLFSITVNSQELAIDTGASITLGVGTSLNVVGLEFQTAVSDFDLTGPYSITSSNTAKTINGQEGITFSFENTLMTGYKGTIVLHYEDSYLNGITEGDLFMNTKDNSDAWVEHDGTAVDQTENTLTMVFPDGSPITFKGVTAAQDQESISIDELDLVIESIHPNPTKNIINIPNSQDFLKEIYSLVGLKLLESSKSTIDISHFSDGIYVLKISDIDNKISKTVKIVKK